MMKGLSLLLVCYYLLILTPRGEARECPSLTADQLARLKKLVVERNVHKEIAGSSEDLWGAKDFYDADPNTCIKHSRKFVNDTVLEQNVEATGKWFDGNHKRNSYLVKVANNEYLEVLHNQRNGKDIVLAKVYVLYAENGVYAYFWCLMYVPEPDAKTSHLPSLSGVTVHHEDLESSRRKKTLSSVQEAVHKIKDNRDILGDIELFKSSC